MKELVVIDVFARDVQVIHNQLLEICDSPLWVILTLKSHSRLETEIFLLISLLLSNQVREKSSHDIENYRKPFCILQPHLDVHDLSEIDIVENWSDLRVIKNLLHVQENGHLWHLVKLFQLWQIKHRWVDFLRWEFIGGILVFLVDVFVLENRRWHTWMVSIPMLAISLVEYPT